MALLNRREDYVKELLKANTQPQETKNLYTEISQILHDIEVSKKNIYDRFLKEHSLSEKLTLLNETTNNITNIDELTKEIHEKVNAYNNYVDKINYLLKGKYSGIFFKIFNIPLAGKIEV